jgi:hypothetical protein
MKAFAIALLLFAACRPPVEKPQEPAAPTPAAETTSAETTPAETTPAETMTIVSEAPEQEPAARNITISGVEIANPIVIRGLARTFENNVALRVRGADGKVLAEGFTTSTGEMGRHNPYRGTLWLTRDPGPRIVVEALEYSAKDGAETNLARVEKPFDVPSIDAVLFIPDEHCTAVKPQTRRMPKSIAMARLLMEALVREPFFPERSAVQSVILREGTVTVDFNGRLQNVGGSCRAQMIREAVTQTLRRLPTVQRVVITADGSEKLALQP